MVKTEQQAVQLIGKEVQFPPFTIASRETPSSADEPLYRPRPDLILELRWKDQLRRFAVEYKSQGTPKQIDLAVQQARRYAAQDHSLLPMVIAPYLRPETLDQLTAESVSGIDLSGNGVVIVPGTWLVLRTGAENKYPTSEPIKNVYRGMSSLVGRALVLRGQFASSKAIWQELQWLGVAPSTISKVLRRLQEEILVQRSDSGGIRVLQPKLLLEQLVRNYRPPRVDRRVRGKLGLTESVWTQLNANAETQEILYASNSGSYTALVSTEEAVRVYATSADRLLKGLSIDETSRFPDIEVVETKEKWVYFDRRFAGNSYALSPLQVYIELATGGSRERQAAEQLLADLLSSYQR